MTTQVPAWLAGGVARRSPQFVATRAGPIVAGDLCLARTYDGGRIVYVIDVDAVSGLSSVVLTTHEVDAITDQDVLVASAETDLPFALVIETDMIGPLPVFVLRDSRIGAAAVVLGAVVDAAREGFYAPSLDGRRGLPLRGAEDARWRFKECEGAALERLVGWGEMEAASAESVVLVDEAVADASVIPELTVVLLRLAMNRVPFPKPVFTFVANPANLEAFGPDAIRAFEPALRLAA